MPRAAGHRRAGERRVPGDQARADPVPARRVRQDRDHHLPRQLPARHGDVLVRAAAAAAARPAPAAALRAARRSSRCCAMLVLDLGPAGAVLLAVFTASLVAVLRERPVAQALRPAAAGLGPGDADADLHPRPRQLADVLRRLPRAALRGHRRGCRWSAWAPRCSSAAPSSSPTASATCRSAWTSGSTRSTPSVVDDEGYQIAQSLFAQADGGLFGQGFGQALLELPGGGTILPAAAHRPDLRGDRQRGRACSAPPALRARLPAVRRRAASRPR